MISIRNEQIKDYRSAEEVARDAFWNLYDPGTDIHAVINQLRLHEDFIPEMTFVIEKDGEIIGGIYSTKSKIIRNNAEEMATITFGPVFIVPKYHRQGMGKKMITHAIEAAKRSGYKAIAILGYPYHYKPYGFVSGKEYNISSEDGKFYSGLQILELEEKALDNIKGYAVFSDAYEVDPGFAEEYDKEFPIKEKKVEPSQKEYEIACQTLA